MDNEFDALRPSDNANDNPNNNKRKLNANVNGREKSAFEQEKTNATIDELLDRSAKPAADPFAPLGPTNFQGLIPGLHPAAQQQQKPAAAGRNVQRRMKTFEDVATNRTKAAAIPALPFSQTEWLPPEMPLGRMNSQQQQQAQNFGALGDALMAANDRSNSMQLAAANTAAAVNNRPSALPPADSAPIDWSLKASVRFTSSQPFTLWKEAKMAPRKDVITAQRAFAACAGDVTLSLRQQLLSSLYSWQYPTHTPSSCGLATPVYVSSDSNRSLIQAQNKAKWADWRVALSSLYDSLQNGCCDAFYVVFQPPGATNATGVGAGNATAGGIGGSNTNNTTNSAILTSRQPLVAFFGASGVAGRRRTHGVLNKSTPGTRALLAQQSVGFATTVEAQEDKEGAFKARRGGAGKAPPAVDKVPESSSNNLQGARSALYFEGSLRTHGLFELLLHRAPELQQQQLASAALAVTGGDEKLVQVPLLISPVQFELASMRTFTLQDGGASRAAAVLDSSHALQYQLSVAGPYIPPWVLDRLLGVLSSVHDDSALTMSCETHQETLNMNWYPASTASTSPPPLPSAAMPLPQEGGGGKTGKCGSKQTKQKAQQKQAVDLGVVISDASARAGGCLHATEAGRWRCAVEGLNGRVVRELKAVDGVFTATLLSSKVL